MRKSNIEASLYRAEIVETILRSLSPKGLNSNILDLGCGLGYALKYLKSLGYRRVTGADYLDESVNALLKQGFRAFQIDLNSREIGMPKKMYDVIISLEVLEHLYDPGYALSSLRTMLNINGIIILSVPNEYRIRKRVDFLRGKEIADPSLVGGHIKFFGYYSFVEFVKTKGLKIIAHFGVGGPNLNKVPGGKLIIKARPDLFAKWTFVVARFPV